MSVIADAQPTDPFVDPFSFWFAQSPWSAKWIAHPDATTQGPSVTLMRCAFDVDSRTRLKIHVTADERYELFLDGNRIGRGSERGDELNWFHEPYELDLTPGRHVLVARTWWHGLIAPYAQVSVRPGFLLMAEGEAGKQMTTGIAPWQCLLASGYAFPNRRQGHFTSVGAETVVDGSKFNWGWETGACDGWVDAAVVGPPSIFGEYGELQARHRLRPALLPPMMERPTQVGIVRLVSEPPQDTPLEEVLVREADHLTSQASAWQALVRGKGTVTIPANARRRVLIDLDEYYCAYPEIVTTGGAGSKVEVFWAESLYESTDGRGRGSKGNRDAIEGKAYVGMGDTFVTDGGEQRRFDSLWWNAGRYIQIAVTTKQQPLTINAFLLRETRYPYESASTFDASDRRLTDVTPIMVRVMQMCMHETYMDCPYYEQLMYVGDTRLEALTTYVTSPDDRLPKKAVLMFDLSRQASGLTTSRYPSRITQVIPPFSLWWVAMVHDLMMYRGEIEFVQDRMPTVRSVLDLFRRQMRDDGLIMSPPGWNFMDWVRAPGWDRGIPPEGEKGPNGSINWLFAYVLKLAAELETFVGDRALADRNWADHKRVARSAANAFWDKKRGLLSEDLAHTHFGEHSQCLALLCDWAITGPRRKRIIDGLINVPDLYRTTIYFTHYLFEAYRLIGRIDKLIDRMGLWFDLKDQGFRTTIESPEPSRSDCHAWGAHPLFHYTGTILGVRPVSPGFETVRIEPQLGPLEWARGTIPHPKGTIEVNAKRVDGKTEATVTLPPGVTGTLVLDGQSSSI